MKNQTTLNVLGWGTLVVAIFVNPLNVSAVPLFTQSPLDGGVSFGASLGDQIATKFSLSQSATVGNIEWWGSPSFLAPQPTNFSIRFFMETSSNMPEINPFSNVSALNLTITPTALNAFPEQTIFSYTADLSSLISLTGNTNYYLSILANTSWGWANSQEIVGPGISWTRLADGGNWAERVSPRAQLAFTLNGSTTTRPPAVSEPSTMFLFGTGLVGLGVWKWKVRRRG